MLRMTRHPLEFVTALARQYGDAALFHIARQPIVLASDPEQIRDVLVTHARLFHKGRGLERAKMLLGEGLLTSEGEFHLRQRRLAQPAFHRARVAAYGDTMARYAERRIATWRDGATYDLTREMATYTLAVVGKTLFDADIEEEAPEIGHALTAALAAFNFSVLPFSEHLLKLPFPIARRFRRARERLDATIYRLIAERRASGEDRGDLLSMLLLAQDSEGDGRGMTDLQLRDEVMTILLAGHETTANALSWMWYLLALNHEARARMLAEVDEVLGDRRPIFDDVRRLPWTAACFQEAMRIFSPAWVIPRKCVEDDVIDGHRIEKGSTVLIPINSLHHDPRFWPQPEVFDPTRFLPENARSHHRSSYLPFGGGRRICIGQSFAMIEATLITAMMSRQFVYELVPGHPVEPEATLTLRPRHGIRMIAWRRSATRMVAAA